MSVSTWGVCWAPAACTSQTICGCTCWCAALQVGLDDVLHSWYGKQQLHLASGAASMRSAFECRAVARRGLPASARSAVWTVALGLPGSVQEFLDDDQHHHHQQQQQQQQQQDRTPPPPPLPTQRAACPALPSSCDITLLQDLCEAVERQPMLTDALASAAASTVAQHRDYFMFEEHIRCVLLALTRDPTISQADAAELSCPKPATEAAVCCDQLLPHPYPPSGVLPSPGLGLLAAPLCYLHEHPAAVYGLFRAMYVRFWSRLQMPCAAPAPRAGLAVLCATLLALLERSDPELAHHLGRLAGSPLQLAGRWLVNAFAGSLSPGETLLLWDRIIGFDSLLPLPVLAVGVLRFRCA